MNKIILAFGIIFLFIVSALAPISIGYNVTTSIIRNDGKTLYVGGSGEGNYTRIQDAIDNASDGDTIFVYSGEYNQGNIMVEKSINIIGENKETTIIDGYGNGIIFYFKTGDITLKKFTIQNAHQSNKYGMGIYMWGKNNNIICENIIQNNDYCGIYAECSNYLYIHNNSFLNNGIADVSGFVGGGVKFAAGSSHNTVERNSFIHNELGIRLRGMDNTICRNYIVDSTRSGIESEYSTSDKIFLNHVENNKVGIYLKEGDATIIGGNNIFNNQEKDAYFINSLSSKWTKNYWEQKIGPKQIKGLIKIAIKFDPYTFEPTKWFTMDINNYDWNPVKEQYDIENDDFNVNIKNARNKVIYNTCLLRFLEQFPFLYLLFQHILE